LAYTKRRKDVMASVPLFGQLLAAHHDMMQVRQPPFDDSTSNKLACINSLEIESFSRDQELHKAN
jgi:hypothetical protein